MVAELAALPVFAWLVTYAVHSTLLLAAAWLVTRRLDRRALRLRERIWKVAVLGGLVTAGLQVGLGLQPLLGGLALRLEGEVAASPADARAPIVVPFESPPRAESLPRAAREPRSSDLRRAAPAREAWYTTLLSAGLAPAYRHAARNLPEQPGQVEAPARTPATLAATQAPAGDPPVAGVTTIDRGLPQLALASWGLALLASLWLIGFGLRRLRRDLAGGFELQSGPWVEALERLRLRAGVGRPVVLYVAPRLAAPLSMGWRSPRICVPPRALEELSREECLAMLAHEVAHLARRDPPWLFVLWLIETLCFFQPLNRLARRELSTSFELSADAWAARATGERLALASCLARIAGWIVGQPAPGAQRALSAAMADTLDGKRPRSRLGDRILRLLAPEELTHGERAGRAELPLFGVLLVGLALAVPGAAAAAAALPAEEPDERTLEDARTPSPAGGDVDEHAAALFGGLDDEMGALAGELGLLRTELQAAAPDPRWETALADLEQRVRSLEQRRRRMQAILASLLAEETRETDPVRNGP